MKAIWDVSNICNLRCLHCAASDFMETNLHIEKNDYVNIINNIKELVDTIDLMGGEPFVSPNIFYILEELYKNKIKTSIITNGQFENLIINKISKYFDNFDSIIISLDGNKKENDMIRGDGSFEKATNFLELLTNKKKEINHEFFIGINMTINNYNFNNIISTIDDLFNKYSINYIQLSPLLLQGNLCNNLNIQISPVDLLNTYENISSYIANSNNNIRLQFPNPILPEYLNAKYNLLFPIEMEKCPAIVQSVYINSEGLVGGCRNVSDFTIDAKKENIATKYNALSEFLKKKDKFHKVNSCDCIYNDICNDCIYGFESEIPPICKLVMERYDINALLSKYKFILKKPNCVQANSINSKIIYPHLCEVVEYEMIGFNILDNIQDVSLSALEISRIVNMDPTLIFRFLIQEKSKKHVDIIK